MKLSKIARICKRHKDLEVYTIYGTQWISIGAAAYPLYGLPEIREKGQLLSLMDVPEKSWEDFSVAFLGDKSAERGEMCADAVSDATILPVPEVMIEYHGGVYLPVILPDSGACVWLGECYLAPVWAEDGLALQIRPRVDGLIDVAVLSGMQVVALIGERLAASEMCDVLADVLGGDKISRTIRDVPWGAVEKTHGYQAMAFGG